MIHTERDIAMATSVVIGWAVGYDQADRENPELDQWRNDNARSDLLARLAKEFTITPWDTEIVLTEVRSDQWQSTGFSLRYFPPPVPVVDPAAQRVVGFDDVAHEWLVENIAQAEVTI